ncbi:MBL fold metallo-hydrolase [Chloroflexota bacterium]
MSEILPGIYRLKQPLPPPASSLGHLNAYLFQGDDGYLLVDAGWNTTESFDSLQNHLAKIHVDIKDINMIIATHMHPDHYGLVGRLKELSQAKIGLHELEVSLIESRYIKMDKLLQQTSQWLYTNGVPEEELHDLQVASVNMAKFVVPTLPDMILHGGEIISTGSFTFQVLWTPGHSPGHICLYEPDKKLLLSGDHILPTVTPIVGSHPQSSDNPLGDFINSLNTIKQLDIDLVLPGHKNPFGNVGERINELMQHHKQRNLDILAKIRTEQKTAYQIAKEIKWVPSKGGIKLEKLPPLHKRLALMETLAHLEYMRTEDRISKFSRDIIIYYQQT